MARNIYSPLIIGTVVYFTVFIILIIVLFSYRMNENYIQKKVQDNIAMVPLKNNPSIPVQKPPPVRNARPRIAQINNSYANTMPVQRQG